MLRIESTLKQLVLLSGLAFVMSQPAYALNFIDPNLIANSPDLAPQLARVAKSKHKSYTKKSHAASEGRFVNKFRIDFLPAIQ
jgi:hypothetical protein